MDMPPKRPRLVYKASVESRPAQVSSSVVQSRAAGLVALGQVAVEPLAVVACE